MKKGYNRRGFLRNLTLASGGVLAGGVLTEASAAHIEKIRRAVEGEKRYAVNDNINVALIGAGGMGTSDLTTALKVPGVKVIAVCDLYDGRLADAKKK